MFGSSGKSSVNFAGSPFTVGEVVTVSGKGTRNGFPDVSGVLIVESVDRYTGQVNVAAMEKHSANLLKLTAPSDFFISLNNPAPSSVTDPNAGAFLTARILGDILKADHLMLNHMPNLPGVVGYDPGKEEEPVVTEPVKKKVTFESVILADDKKEQIEAALAQLKFSDLIFKEWGFGKIFEKGTAVSLLFYGEPGTGKTLMAQAIADRLDSELKLIDTAMIESSEPGQAERNLKAIFEGANEKTVLLFDECDSLIADRNVVGMILGAQINALLTALEQFTGVAIFTTNRLGSLDAAFNRRLSLKLEFEMPNHEQRKAIWQRMFPEEAPLEDDIDWDSIASVEVAGGYVKNAVLRSARMTAARGDKRISGATIKEALRVEIKSLVAFNEAVRKNNGLPRLAGHSMANTINRTITKGN